jgi:hypothetical protein
MKCLKHETNAQHLGPASIIGQLCLAIKVDIRRVRKFRPNKTKGDRYNRPVDRVNSQGIPLAELNYTLRQPRFVRKAIRANRCLLCCREKVNEAGLCEFCYSQLDEPELRLAERWIAGVGP